MRISTTALLQFVLRLASAVFGMLALVYFGNVLGSAKIGTYTLALTVAVWLWVVADPGIGSALIKRVSEGTDEAEFFTAASVMVFGIVSLIVVAILLFRDQIQGYVGMEAAPFLVALVVSKMFFLLVTGAIAGHDRVATKSILRFVERTLRPGLQILGVFFGFGVAGLLSGYVGSLVVGSIAAVWFLPSGFARPAGVHFRRLYDFAKFAVLKMVRSRAARWTDTAVLGFFVTANLVGIYEIAWSVALVLILATDSLISSLFPTMSALASDDRVDRVRTLTESGLTFTGVITVPGVVGALIVGEDVLRLFGPEFTAGIAVLPILVTWSLVVSYEHVHRSAMDALDRPDLTFRVDVFHVVANVVGNVSLVYLFGWVGAAVATTMAGFLSFGVAVFYTNTLMDVEYPTAEVAKQFLAAGIMAVAVLAVHRVTTSMPRVYVLVPIGAGVAVYFPVLLALSDPIREKCTGLFDGVVG
jgi:O-antigen/teichoic acid export membrane protein